MLSRRLTVPALSFLFASTALAASAPTGPLLVEVSARPGTRADTLVVRVVAGRSIVQASSRGTASPLGRKEVQAYAVYSEPSHTLLAAAEDATFATTSAGRAWLADASKHGLSDCITTLDPHGGAIEVLALRPPISDTRVVVLARSRDAEQKLVDATMTPPPAMGFNFSTYEAP